jgi:carbonic anhydrase
MSQLNRNISPRLRQIRDVYRLHKDHLDHIEDYEERHCRLVELNVIEQCLNLYKTGACGIITKNTQKNDYYNSRILCTPSFPFHAPAGVVQRKRMQTGKVTPSETNPRIYGLVFNPADGLLKKLSVDFEKRVGNLEHIYSLY